MTMSQRLQQIDVMEGPLRELDTVLAHQYLLRVRLALGGAPVCPGHSPVVLARVVLVGMLPVVLTGKVFLHDSRWINPSLPQVCRFAWRMEQGMGFYLYSFKWSSKANIGWSAV